jgi:magnesium-protoporphyrin O-methyltransferase
VFDERFARSRARRYRRKGLDATARRMVDLLADDGLDGATVLEVGGGVGEIGLELLRHGAASVTNLELSPGYDEQAAELIAEAGLSGRVSRRLVDIAAEPDAVEPADVVVLHRVVCCYPDFRRLLTAVAMHGRRRVVFSFPRRNAIVRAFLAVQNRLLRMSGREFQAFAHRPAEMFAVLAEHGLRPAIAHRGAVWQVATAGR